MAPRQYMKKSEKRVPPENAALATKRNPKGLKDKAGFRITKTGHKKAVNRANAKPRANIKNEPNWIEYHALKERPQGMNPFEKDENGNILVKHAEIYCRVQLETGELCHDTIRYSDINNLKKHIVKTHDLPVLDCKHRGTKTRAEVAEAAEWCGQVMATHMATVLKQKEELEKMRAKKAEEEAKKARDEDAEKSAATVAAKQATFKQVTSKKGETAKGAKGRKASKASPAQTSKGRKCAKGAKASQTQAKDDGHSDSGIGHDDSGIGGITDGTDAMELDSDMDEVIQPTEPFAIIE